tara:strand:+ start:2009 stop:2695 length:687 start_codon:yes stop_codon:yes gene_type:complete
MTKFLTRLTLGLCLAATLTGCGREKVTGTGTEKQEVRNTAEFTGLNVNGNYAIAGSIASPQKVVIGSNENILPYITSSVSSDVLMIDQKSSVELTPTVEQKIWFFTNEFNSLTLTGASQFQFLGLKTDKLNISLTGSHRLIFTGTAGNLHIVVHGNSDIDAKKLLVENADIEINGDSTVLLNPTKTLKVTINGNGKVVYYNKEPKIEKIINGSGQVISGFGGITKESE